MENKGLKQRMILQCQTILCMFNVNRRCVATSAFDSCADQSILNTIQNSAFSARPYWAGKKERMVRLWSFYYLPIYCPVCAVASVSSQAKKGSEQVGTSWGWIWCHNLVAAPPNAAGQFGLNWVTRWWLGRPMQKDDDRASCWSWH